MPRSPRSALTGAQRMLVLVAVGAVVTACTAAPEPVASTPSATVAPAPVESPSEPAAPAFVPDGTATENLPYFAEVVGGVWAGPDSAAGRAYIDALVAAGFDRNAMQVTNDTTTLGNPVESIQFSVLFADECLVGQVGPETGDPVTVVLPVIEGTHCLVGQTRPIDW
ncbi:hypothetical protein AB2L57_10360 [Microbacterium sp. HA-8]|uniref:DUF6993 domain-containing protein n=1 Tax=unclassified Microbacterium TaxID=2609290 RepID=UPI0025DC279A|nr:hypothetical protein [Microbacterium sp.]